MLACFANFIVLTTLCPSVSSNEVVQQFYAAEEVKPLLTQLPIGVDVT